MTGPGEMRAERRITIDSIVLPFLGSRAADFQPFQYILQDVSPTGVRIAIPSWVVNREHLTQGEEIHFHVPFLLDGRLLNVGRVAWARWEEEEDAQVVGAALERALPVNYPVRISHSTSTVETDLGRFETPENLVRQVLGDTVLLKRGVLIYLRHLSAFFRRASGMSHQEYEFFREAVIRDARQKAQKNLEMLEEMAERDAVYLDLEELRRATEPEVYIDLFRTALGADTVRLYLDAVKQLEKKLYANYNTLVMLYIQWFDS